MTQFHFPMTVRRGVLLLVFPLASLFASCQALEIDSNDEFFSESHRIDSLDASGRDKQRMQDDLLLRELNRQSNTNSNSEER